MVNAIDIVNMQTEYLNEPLGIDVVQPRFSYQITSTAALRGLSQKSYLIRPPLTSPLTIERKEKRNMARSQSMQPLRDLKDDFQYATVPDTPIQKIRVPKGGWLQSETRRRTGPGALKQMVFHQLNETH